MKEPQLIQVRSAIKTQKDGGNKCVLFEKDARHPEGEIFITEPDEWVEVFPTAGVRLAIAQGKMVERGAETEIVAPPDASDADVDDADNADNGEGDDVSKFEIQLGETAESLADRMTKSELLEMAQHYEVEADGNATKKEIATVILSNV